MKKLVLLSIFLLPIVASADYIEFEFEGRCAVNCDDFGMAPGDSVSGYLQTLTGLDDDNILMASELTGFGFSFGPNVMISDATHYALGALVSDDERTSLFNSDFIEWMTFQQLANPGSGATTGSLFGSLDLGLSGWIAHTRETTCQSFFFDCTTVVTRSGGPGTYTRVPEPGALSLIGIALIAFGISTRRNRAKSFSATGMSNDRTL